MINENGFGIKQILSYLPHRYPFVLLDKIIFCLPFETVQAIKNVSYNENFFTGHFPQEAIMPGVLVVEAMAQAGGFLLVHSLKTEQEQDISEQDSLAANGKLFMLAGINKARFNRPVRPGDQLVIDVKTIKRRSNIWLMAAEAKVAEKRVATAEFMLASE